MTGRSLGILIVCIALVVTSCDLDGAAPDTGPSDSEPITQVEVTGSCEEVRTTAEGEGDFPALLFVPGLVAVDEGSGAMAVGELGEDRITNIGAAEAYQELGDLSDQTYQEDVVGQIDGLVDFLATDESPVEIALELQGFDIDASPVSAIGFVGHWGYRPGSEPAPIAISGDLEGALGVQTEALVGYVGVVDSGIDDTRLPSWMEAEAVIYDSEDTETGGVASHGTFVADLIRRIAPAYGVSLAKARTLPGVSYDVYPEGHDKPQLQVSNELDVAYAVVRLMRRDLDPDLKYSALNLSLGAYIADPSEPGDRQLILLQNVLASWEGGPILAAAGNEDLTLPHFPAAFSTPNVVSVAAGDTSQAAVPTLPSGVSSQWFDHIVPGVELVGLAGGADQDGDPRLVCWSGSSFATAVATAMTVQGNSLTPDPNYGSVPGLSYIDSTGNLVVNP